MIFKLGRKIITRKAEAFKNGTRIISELKIDFDNYYNQTIGDSINKENYIGINPIDITKFIYNNDKFYEYVKYSFLGKHYEKQLTLLYLIIVLIALIIDIILYFIFKFGLIFIISTVLLGSIIFIIFAFMGKDESYSNYYNRTMVNFILSIYNNLNFKLDRNKTLLDNDIKQIIYNLYDKKKFNNNISFNCSLASGNIIDMNLIKTRNIKDNNGNIRKKDEEIFDGFYLKINTANNNNLLRGNTIRIKADENILSSMAEDTVKGMYESNLEFNFNSEEMNKSFDCKISGYRGFNDVDEMMMTVHKIITPSFEEHLLYLRERYNTFNMNISDNGIIAAFNMKRSTFQKMKHNELLDFKTTYREANENFKMLSANVFGISDFTYCCVFPVLERLYFIKYLTYLYLSYIDFDNYYSINNDSINSFEEGMKNIYTMDNKEFKEIYVDKLKEIKENTKEFAKTFEEKEKLR